MEEMNMENMPMTAQEISGELMEDAAIRQEQDAAQTEAAIREGLAELFEDGWTAQELELLSPGRSVRRFMVETLIDDKGERSERANRSGLRYAINCPYRVQQGDILRVRAPKEGSHTDTLNRGSFHKNA